MATMQEISADTEVELITYQCSKLTIVGDRVYYFQGQRLSKQYSLVVESMLSKVSWEGGAEVDIILNTCDHNLIVAFAGLPETVNEVALRRDVILIVARALRRVGYEAALGDPPLPPTVGCSADTGKFLVPDDIEIRGPIGLSRFQQTH